MSGLEHYGEQVNEYDVEGSVDFLASPGDAIVVPPMAPATGLSLVRGKEISSLSENLSQPGWPCYHGRFSDRLFLLFGLDAGIFFNGLLPPHPPRLDNCRQNDTMVA